VRRAARDELRKGAHCIKIMASGGVSSPTDRLASCQFSEGELEAIVDEAARTGTYCCAHAYTSEAIGRALKAGVQSIEHGNYLDGATAVEMARRGAVLVPTIITYVALQEGGAAAAMRLELVAKVGDLAAAGRAALAAAVNAGVEVAYGSDLLGSLRCRQAEGLLVHAEVAGAAAALRHATAGAAALFERDSKAFADGALRIGKVEAGYAADLLVLEADPLEDPSVLADPRRMLLIMREGVAAKCALAAAALPGQR
jgi:imidazolonepropionase-like amidohydrolase